MINYLTYPNKATITSKLTEIKQTMPAYARGRLVQTLASSGHNYSSTDRLAEDAALKPAFGAEHLGLPGRAPRTIRRRLI
jgi:hypothetical protein